MSNKKSLLTESEIRRFMKLANIPAIGKELVKEESEAERRIKGDTEATSLVQPKNEGYGDMEEEGYGDQEEMGYMSEEDEMPVEDDMGGGDASEADLEQLFTLLKKVMKPELADQFDVDAGGGGDMDLEVGDEGGEGESMEEPMEEPAGEEEEEEEELDEAEEVEEEEKETQKLDESKLVDVVLSRVTARLIAEAKKKKMTAAEKKKKEEEAKKKKEAMKKKAAAAKKKLEEANAPAPKSSMSNASAAGVAKGNGPGSKAFGTDEKKSMKWKAGKGEKGHALQTVSASAEHTVSHGKKNLAVQGGNKKG